MPAYVFTTFPRVAGARFDVDYYINKHIKIVERVWTPYGLKSWRIVEFQEGDPSGLHIQTITEWDSIESAKKAIDEALAEIKHDRENFTDLHPQRYFANALKQSD